MLYSEHFPATEIHQGSTLPTLVFLHGLLGSGEDWQQC
ncbi:2-succinyl-6-hydroxy-2,4-cyclohexadiene-1-carboxylate synthase, partial [Vibrio rotiferianus]